MHKEQVRSITSIAHSMSGLCELNLNNGDKQMKIINGDLVLLEKVTDAQLENLCKSISTVISTGDGNTYVPLDLIYLVPKETLSLESRLKLYGEELAKGVEAIENDNQVRDNIKIYFSMMPEYIQDMLLNTCNAEVMDIIG